MSDFESQRIDERVRATMDQWPTLTEALGCMDCQQIFRLAIDNKCALCGSQSILNVADYFNSRTKGE